MNAVSFSPLSAPLPPLVLKTRRRCHIWSPGSLKLTVQASTAQTPPPHWSSSAEKLKEFTSILTVPKSQGFSLAEPPVPDDGLREPQIGISAVQHGENSSRPPEVVTEGSKERIADTRRIMMATKKEYAVEFGFEAAERIDDASSIPGYDKNVVRADHDGVIPLGYPAGIDMDYGLCGLPIIPNADLEGLEVLGSGRNGTVYHANWRGTDVVIKRFKKSHLAEDYLQKDRLTKTFWREAQILSKLRHPQVVAFYGVVLDGPEGTLALVTEYMVDGSLSALLEKGELDLRTKLIFLLGAASGMEYVHSQDVIHFDLKGANLLVSLGDPQRPVCKVADFGLSKIKQNALVSGRKRGPLRQMAPELLCGTRNEVDEKVDVYSFGITICETLTGEVPYGDLSLDAIKSGVAYSNLRPAIPEYCHPELRKLMEECWSPDPAARPSFTQIRERLQAVLMAL